uniref:Uncharacterized protein n=1 Tax=Arundo donax TaxID=35708 RepID=A0A0A9HCT4_ARUDO
MECLFQRVDSIIKLGSSNWLSFF